MTEITEIKTEEEKKTAFRSNLYIALGTLFRYPDDKYIADISSGAIQNKLLPLVKELPYPVNHSDFLNVNFMVENLDDFQSEYIKTFDVSPGGPPCPLYEGLYYPDRRRVMEDLMRFYEHFGLKPDVKKNEFPDHISMELEFMHFLSFKETMALTLGKDTKPLRLAERDFLAHHLVKWLPMLNKKLSTLNPPEFYKKLFLFLEEFINNDYNYIKNFNL